MALSSQQVAEAVYDDEGYIRRISPSTIQDGEDLRIISIPRSSFTAYRLSHASPVELSLSSKVVLLGGIPSHWVREQSKRFWRATSKIGSRGLHANADRLLSRGYLDVYRRDQTRGRRVYADVCGCQSPACGDYKYQVSVRSMKSGKSRSTRASSFSLGTGKFSKKRSNTVAAIPTQGLSAGKKELKQGSNAPELPKRKTIAVLTSPHAHRPSETGGYSTDDLSELTSRCTDDDSYSSENYEEKEDHTLAHPSEMGHLPHRSSADKQDLVDKAASLDIDDNFRHDNSRKICSVELEAARSDIYAQEPSLGPISTTETTPVSYIDSPYLSNNTQDREGKSSKIRFADLAQQDRGKGYTRGKRRQIVRLKPTYNSKSAEPLRILVPEPYKPYECSDEQMYKKHFKTERLVAKRVGYVGERAKFKMKKSVSSIFGTDYSISSPFFKRLKRGRIILMEKMLVMVKSAVNKKEPVFCFSQEESIDTRVTDRWKEYIVVARSTGRGDSSILLQFYRRRHIPTHVNNQKDLTHGTSLDFQVDKQCLVGIYGSLDKSIYIQKPVKKDIYGNNGNDGNSSDNNNNDPLKIYILKCGTLQSSGKWYNVLRSAIKMKDKVTQISFKIPEAELSVEIKLKEKFIRDLIESENDANLLKLCVLRRGYRVLQHPLMRYLTVTVFEELKKAGLSEITQKWELANIILGCNYKYYDLLQWCSNSNSTTFLEILPLFKSYLLELRPYVPPPREVFAENRGILIEPAPVEGFLIRLTNRSGKEGSRLRKLFLRPSYFFTNDNLMFFMSSFKASPPLPSNIADTKHLHREKRLQNFPSVYEQEPYPLDLSSHISWLKEEVTDEDFKTNDIYALKCFNRRVDQILKAEGVLDLCEIEHIYHGTSSDMKGSEIRYRILHLARRSFWHSQGDDVEGTATSVLFIVMRNGLVLKLLAPDSTVCKEWVSRLESLTSYWKARKACDTRKMWDLKLWNMQQLKITNEEESNINDATPKWILDRGFSDATLHNVNALCQLRPLLRSGILYQKPKKHSTFTKYLVLLIPGFLILFELAKRTTSGFAKNVINHKHYLTISIADCYLYSGSASKLDLLNRRNKIEELSVRSNALPRAYSDGWRSTEDESTRCFTLWFGKKRAMLAGPRTVETRQENYKRQEKSDTHKNFESNPNVFRMVSRLGVSGKSLVFMARSRQERNLWVLSISSEIEKLKKNSKSPV